MAYDKFSVILMTLGLYGVIAFVIGSMLPILKQLRLDFPAENSFETLKWISWAVFSLAIITGIAQATVIYLGKKSLQFIVPMVCFSTAAISGLLIWMAVKLGSYEPEDDLTGQVCHFLMLQTIAMATLAFTMIIIVFLQYKDLP